MAIVKVDPFRELTALQDRMARLFGDVYLRDEDTGFRGSWTPAGRHLRDRQPRLVIKAELPDMTREDIEVTVENNTLVLKGTKKFDGEVKDENYRRIERRYGTFHRSFTLPNTVDAREGERRLQERRADREAAVPRGSEAAHDQRRSRGVTTEPPIPAPAWIRRPC